MSDSRWNKSKTNAAIKKKLREIGLIVAVAPARKKKAPRGPQRSRRVGDLDKDFAESLMSTSDKIRKSVQQHPPIPPALALVSCSRRVLPANLARY